MDFNIVRKYLKTSTYPVVVDLGAQVGDYSEFLWLMFGPQARLISVEPHPMNTGMIMEKISHYNEIYLKQHPSAKPTVTDRWTVDQCAVDTVNGEAAFWYHQRDSSPNGSLNMIMKPVDSYELFVKKKRIETICPAPVIIKIDIEGHEWIVLPDIVRIPSVESLIIEFHNIGSYKLEEYLGLLGEHGFKHMIGQTDTGVFVENVPVTTNWDDVPKGPSDVKIFHVLAWR